MGKKLSFDYVRQYFIDNGCELKDKKYVNNRTLMRYMCVCGGHSKISFDSFKRGRRCIKCGGSEKLTYDYVKQYFKDNNCELLDGEYKNNSTKMKYICACGNIGEICFSDFQRGRRCSKCGKKRAAEKRRLIYKYVYDYFKQHNCELLDNEYINISTPMKYRCSCKIIGKIRFDDFKNGHRCKKCGIKKVSGKNSCNYNPNLTDEERKIKRKYPEYKKWVSQVFNRDNYTCQKCNKRGSITLNSHHLKNYAEHKDLRLDEKNGLTFCENCHKQFHLKYGHKNNNEKQVREFIKS